MSDRMWAGPDGPPRKEKPESVSKGLMFWRTVGAMVLASMTWTVVAMMVGFLLSVWNRLITVVRPEVIDFFAAITAAIVGVVAARAVCNKILRIYAKRPIFFLFTSLAIAGLVVEFLLLEKPKYPITVSAQMIVLIVAAWIIFWRRDEHTNR